VGMAPKAAPSKGSAPAPPQEDVEAAEALAFLQEGQSAETVASGLVTDVFEEAWAAIQTKAIECRALPTSVLDVTGGFLSVVNVYFLECDPGEPNLASCATWAPDEEPAPAAIDTWSRGSGIAKEREPLATMRDGDITPRSSSAGSRVVRSPRGRSRESNTAEEKKGEKGEKAEILVAKRVEKPGQVVEAGKGGKLQSIITDAEAEQMRRDEVERIERNRHEALMAELKGREYTCDAFGNVMVVEPVKPERLPPWRLNPRIGMADRAPPEVRAKAGGRSKPGGREAAKPSSAKPELVNPALFKPLDSLQPPLFETTVLREGVTLRQGEVTKMGANRSFDGQRMSRRDFEMFTRTAAGGSRRLGDGEGDAAGAEPDPVADEPPSPETPAATGVPDMGKDWGVNPPVKPFQAALLPINKPQLSPQGFGPRKRAGTQVRNHLPPPTLGATSGHGFDLPYSKPGGSAAALRPVQRAGAPGFMQQLPP